MHKPTERFAHVMLFECPDCTLAISLALTRDMRNFEDTDEHSYPLRCSCGWSGSLLGAVARRHWVEPWHAIKERSTPSASATTYLSDQI